MEGNLKKKRPTGISAGRRQSRDLSGRKLVLSSYLEERGSLVLEDIAHFSSNDSESERVEEAHGRKAAYQSLR